MKELTDDEVKAIAVGILQREIFTDRHINESCTVEQIFMPLIMLNKQLVDELKSDPPGIIYEHLSEAGPMAINGNPMFMSMHVASIKDAERIWQYYNRLTTAIEGVK